MNCNIRSIRAVGHLNNVLATLWDSGNPPVRFLVTDSACWNALALEITVVHFRQDTSTAGYLEH
jgi:hypothetical protein